MKDPAAALVCFSSIKCCAEYYTHLAQEIERLGRLREESMNHSSPIIRHIAQDLDFMAYLPQPDVRSIECDAVDEAFFISRKYVFFQDERNGSVYAGHIKGGCIYAVAYAGILIAKRAGVMPPAHALTKVFGARYFPMPHDGNHLNLCRDNIRIHRAR